MLYRKYVCTRTNREYASRISHAVMVERDYSLVVCGDTLHATSLLPYEKAWPQMIAANGIAYTIDEISEDKSCATYKEIEVDLNGRYQV